MPGNHPTLNFATAEEFLSALRPSHSRWLGQNWNSPWIFRGQGDTTWGLTPSAWRPSIQNDEQFKWALETVEDDSVELMIRDNRAKLNGIKRGFARSLVGQQWFEYLQVQSFASLADELGIHIPGGHLPKGLSTEIFLRDGLGFRPHPAFALAQHHGMATRLLDWTRNPLFAAFFASESPDNANGSIAVWAFDTRPLLIQSSWVQYDVPRSEIGFLHAQAGLFTYHQSADAHFVQNGEWPCLENDFEPESLMKLVLPSSEAGDLRRLLFAEGVSRVHLMPTLDNIRRTLQTLWRDVENSRLCS